MHISLGICRARAKLVLDASPFRRRIHQHALGQPQQCVRNRDRVDEHMEMSVQNLESRGLTPPPIPSIRPRHQLSLRRSHASCCSLRRVCSSLCLVRPPGGCFRASCLDLSCISRWALPGSTKGRGLRYVQPRGTRYKAPPQLLFRQLIYDR